MKKLLVTLVASTLAVLTITKSELQTYYIKANSEENSMIVPVDLTEHGMGGLSPKNDICETPIPDVSDDILRSMPSSFDISTHSAFPPIGNQGNIKSCASWATTYYTYTYMVHKAKNITTTYNNSYSPRWTYNLINGGLDSGSNIVDNMRVLQYQGALNISQYPYLINNNYYSFDWSNDTQAMINALSTRISSSGYYTIDTSGSYLGTDFQFIISVLCNEIPLICSMYSSQNLSNCTLKQCSDNSHNGEYIYVRNASSTNNGNVQINGHVVTVVGYDDNIWCDVNSNNIVDAGETGALKIANSWGNTWCNSGYAWILYDALLDTSQIKSRYNSQMTWDEQFYSIRTPFFGNVTDGTRFYWMNISDYTVGYVTEVNISTSSRNQLMAGTLNNGYYDPIYLGGNFSNPISFTGTIVLNHENSSDIEASISNYEYGSSVGNWYYDYYPISVSSWNLVDNRRNVIKNISSGATLYYNFQDMEETINLTRGDVDYDEYLTTDDANMILDFIAHSISLSNIQIELADYNNNGVVDVTDYSLVYMNLSRKGFDMTELDEKYDYYSKNGFIS